MPIYEFTCPKCGHTFDELLPSSRSGDSVPCPSCKAKGAKRNITSFASTSGSKPAPSGGGGCAPRGRVG